MQAPPEGCGGRHACQAQDETTDRRLGQRATRVAVRRDSDGLELFGQNACVRLRWAVEHGDATRRDALVEVRDHRTHDRPNFGVCVADADDAVCGRGADFVVGEGHAQPSTHGFGNLIGSWLARDAEHDVDIAHRRNRPQQCRFVPQQPSGEVNDERSETIDEFCIVSRSRSRCGRMSPSQTGCLAQQVEFVVPVVGENLGGALVQADDFTSPRRHLLQVFELVGSQIAQFSVHTRERCLSSGVIGDGCEHAGVFGKRMPDGSIDDVVGDRAATAYVHPRRRQPLRQSEHRDCGDRSQTVSEARHGTARPGGQRAPKRDTRIVGRHDNRHFREGIVRLGARDEFGRVARARDLRTRPGAP